jgi:hypothetical protein
MCSASEATTASVAFPALISTTATRGLRSEATNVATSGAPTSEPGPRPRYPGPNEPAGCSASIASVTLCVRL